MADDLRQRRILQGLRDLEREATMAPWTTGRDEYQDFVEDFADGTTLFRPGSNNPKSRADARLVAAMRNYLPDLLDALEARGRQHDEECPVARGTACSCEVENG